MDDKNTTTVISNTRQAVSDMTNRREIPVTSFDFLNGAYNTTRTTRAVLFLLMIGSFAAAAWVLFMAFNSFTAVNSIRSEAESLASQRDIIIAEFGDAAGSASINDLVIRDQALSQSLQQITATQLSLTEILLSLSSVASPTVEIRNVSIGGSIPSWHSNPIDDENFLTVAFQVSIDNPIGILDFLDSLETSEFDWLINLDHEVSDSTVSVAGYINSEPPSQIQQFLIDLGITPVSAADLETSIDIDEVSGSSEEAGSSEDTELEADIAELTGDN